MLECEIPWPQPIAERVCCNEVFAGARLPSDLMSTLASLF